MGETCCDEKTVGGVKYLKLGEEDTTNFGCENSCVYTNPDILGSKYCFKKGDLSVDCGKKNTAKI